MIYENLGCEISAVVIPSYMLSPVSTQHTTNLMLNSSTYLKKFVKILPISKSSMPLLSGPDLLAEKIKLVHLQCYVWLNVVKATLPSLDIECCDWKVTGG